MSKHNIYKLERGVYFHSTRSREKTKYAYPNKTDECNVYI